MKLLPLFFVLFIDTIGLGLVLPLLSGIVYNHSFNVLNSNPSLGYGVIIGIYMLSWFFGSAVLGDLSDRVGRKKALLISLLGNGIGYFIAALSISLHSLLMFIVSRLIAGLSSGSQPIAQAAIIDSSTTEQKTRNMSYMCLSLSLGFILGPLLGSFFSNSTIFKSFNFSTPFYFATVLTLLNIIFLIKFFNEPVQHIKKNVSINFYHAVNLLLSAYKNKKIRKLSFIYAIFIFGWSSFYTFIPLFLMNNNYSVSSIGQFMAIMGVGFAIGNAFVAERITKIFSLKTAFSMNMFISSALTLLILYTHNIYLVWAEVIVLAACIASATPAIYILFANEVDASSQGWVMGITGSILAFVWGLNAIVLSVFISYSSLLIPIYSAIASLLIAAFYSSSLQAKEEKEILEFS